MLKLLEIDRTYILQFFPEGGLGMPLDSLDGYSFGPWTITLAAINE